MSQENVEAYNARGQCQRPPRSGRAARRVRSRCRVALGVVGTGPGLSGQGGRRRKCSRTWTRTSRAWSFEFPEVRDLGDRVLALGRLRARPRERVETEVSLRPARRLQERQGRSGFGHSRPPGRPRSRRAVGVGDVAGESVEALWSVRTALPARDGGRANRIGDPIREANAQPLVQCPPPTRWLADPYTGKSLSESQFSSSSQLRTGMSSGSDLCRGRFGASSSCRQRRDPLSPSGCSPDRRTLGTAP